MLVICWPPRCYDLVIIRSLLVIVLRLFAHWFDNILQSFGHELVVRWLAFSFLWLCTPRLFSSWRVIAILLVFGYALLFVLLLFGHVLAMCW